MTALGIVRDVEENDVHFVSAKKLKAGDFVAYRDRWVGPERAVLCRVRYARSLKTYPDEFVLETGVSPREILEFAGMATEDYDRYLITASIVGYFDPESGEFRHPRAMPDSGETLFEAGPELLSAVSKVRQGERGTAAVGAVLGTQVPVVLSVRDLVSQHLSVIASTGSGKSYTVGVLCEELLMPRNRGAVLVVDPHGEYNTLAEAQNRREFRAEDYMPTVKILRKGSVKIKVGELDLEDFLGMLDLTDKMQHFFRRAYYDWRDAGALKKSDLRQHILSLRDPSNESTIDGILWRYDSVIRRGIFEDHQHTPLRELFAPGQLSILDLSGLSQSEQQLIAAVLLRRLYDAREGTVNQRFEEGQEKYLPYPVFLVLEEAHRYAPQNGEARSKAMLKTILAEGRKFGIGVCLVSQRPSKLDSDSLSQCMTQITMRIINPADQGQIAASVETMSRELLDELPALARGEAIVSGVAVNTPVMVKVRERLTAHGGVSRDAPEEWASQWKKLKASKAVPAVPQKEYKLF